MFASRDAILDYLQEVQPDEGRNPMRTVAAQINQFFNRIGTGDFAVMPRKTANGETIGIVTGGYQFGGDSDFFRLRLWQMPDLLKALFRTCDRLFDETRAKLPLKRIWPPTAGVAE